MTHRCIMARKCSRPGGLPRVTPKACGHPPLQLHWRILIGNCRGLCILDWWFVAICHRKHILLCLSLYLSTNQTAPCCPVASRSTAGVMCFAAPTLYSASKAPSRALGSLLSKHCTKDMRSSGHVGRPPTPTITATLVPTTCRKGLLGLLMACNSATCHMHMRTQKASAGPECNVHFSTHPQPIGLNIS